MIFVVGTPARGAQDERWSKLATTTFTHVAQDSELPNSAIPQHLAQDGAGFLWMGTDNGLARWDGYRFRIFKPDVADAGSVPDSVIEALHTDERGRLWIGTDSAGLARYDPDLDRFVRLPIGPSGIRGVVIFSIADDGRGGIWVASGGGVDHVPANGRITHARAPAVVHALVRDRRGNVWGGTVAGIVRLTPGEDRFEALPGPSTGADAIDVRCLFVDDDGRIWAGTRGHGAYVLERPGAALRPIRLTSGSNLELGTRAVLGFAQAGTGNVWLATDGAGIVAVDTQTFRTYRIRHDPGVPSSLPSNSVMTLFRDRAGLLWVATVRSLSHRGTQATAIATVFGDATVGEHISDPDVRAVLTRPDGTIWAGVGRSGIDIIDPAGGGIASERRLQTTHDSVRFNVHALAADKAGNEYIGTQLGLYRKFGGRGPATPISLPIAAAGGIRSILADGDRVWFSGLNGLWMLDRSGHAHRILTGALTDERVTVMAHGTGKSIWIGTENGLNRFDPASGAVERILPDLADPRALSAGLISTLLTDRSGRLWVGTQGGGINVLTAREHGRPRFDRLGIAEGLPNDDIDKLLTDHFGNVWASTDDGLAWIDAQTHAVRAFRAADGVGIAGYWANAGDVTAQGELLFGGLGGLTIVRPDAVQASSYRAPVVVTEIRVAGQPVPASRFNAVDAAMQPLEVAPGGNSFVVGFAALDYSAPERSRYSYKLDGFDTSWVEVDATQRFAAYTNLPPGDYHLNVRGTNRDGLWSTMLLRLPIRVFPAWYQTVAFRIAQLFAAVFGVLVVLRIRTALLRRRQHELEREVAARTAELHAAQQRLERIAYFDTLTALPNRRMFIDDFRQLIVAARRARGSFAVILLDLDGFKTINDTLGHDAGDAVLVEASARLRNAVRESDCVARLGGDEFAILLTGDRAAVEVETICRRIVESFAAAIPLGDCVVQTSTSIGIALYPRDGESQDSVYKAADLALYDAKHAGRNTWRWYRAELRA